MSTDFTNDAGTGTVVADGFTGGAIAGTTYTGTSATLTSTVTANTLVVANGVLTIAHIPTANTHVVGQVYANATTGALFVSLG